MICLKQFAISPCQGTTPVRGAPGWLARNPVRGMREPPSGSMQLQKLQFQSVIYGIPEHSNWHQSFSTHIWLSLAQCGMLAGFIKTMLAEEKQNYKNISILCRVKPKHGEKKSNISKNHLSTVNLKSSEKINTIKLFLSLRTVKSNNFWSVVRKVPVWS